MPTASNFVGLLELPIPAGAQDSALPDPTLVGLLAYLGHWLSVSLDDKLEALRGTNASIAGACPVANRFPWDPSTYFVRAEEAGRTVEECFPALYAWRSSRGRRVPYSTVKSMRHRDLMVQYIFDELALPGAWVARSGLLNAVDAVFSKAAEWNYHPTFGYNGAPLGTPITTSLKLSGPGLQYLGGEDGLMSPVPGQSFRAGAQQDGHVLRGFPTLRGHFQVWELVQQADASDPDDVGRDILATIKANTEGSVTDAVEVMQRYLPAPDGTEVP